MRSHHRARLFDVGPRVHRVLVRRLRLDPAVCSSGTEVRLVEDLGLDGLAIAELTLALEEELDIDISADEANDFRTVHDVVERVRRLLASRGAG